MKLQGGSVYLVTDPIDTRVMGCVVRRMWWKPWHWSVRPIYCLEVAEKGSLLELRDGEAVKDLTMLGAVGILKLYGVRHRDFE
jgi:hypothetical protein